MSSNARRVVHVSDVEGSFNRLQTFVERAPGLAFDDDGRIMVDDDTIFVFGGDAVDRGPWSRRVVRTLIDVKERAPDRVVLLVATATSTSCACRESSPGPCHAKRLPRCMPSSSTTSPSCCAGS